MKQLLSFLLLGLMLVFSRDGLAMSCTSTNGDIAATADIDSPVAVPPTLPVGSVIWRSKQYTAQVKCWQDRVSPLEWAYLYMNYTDPNQSMLGEQIEIGLNYNGRDYYCSSPEMQDGGYCRMDLGILFGGCSVATGCPDKARIINTTFNFFIAKKKNGPAGQEGMIPNLPPTYPAVQFGGSAGLHSGLQNYTVVILGFNNLRYVGCSSTIDVSPRAIDFGTIGSFSAKKGTIIQDRPIVITANKTCNSAYGLGGNFFPVSGRLTDANKTLVPANNSSVGIQLLDTKDQKPIEFKKEFELVPLKNRDLHTQKNIVARLLWNADTAVIGDFNASVKLEIYYK